MSNWGARQRHEGREREDSDPLQRPESWELFFAHDYGSAAPSATYVVAWSPGAVGPDGRFYSRDSHVVVDELVSNVAGELNVGKRWTVDRLAGELGFLAERWRMDPSGVGDPAIYQEHGHNEGSIGAQLRSCGVDLEPAPRLPRVDGWEKLRQLLLNAGQRDLPGLYVCRRCRYLLDTLPHLPRDRRRPDDLDTTGPDHGADALRYGILRRPGPAFWSQELL